MRPETVPLVVVALLLLSAQPGVETISTVVGGSQSIDGEADADAVIVVDGNATVPADTRANTSLYVLDGTVQVDGALAGDLVQLSGRVSVGPDAAVTGAYRQLGGTSDVAEGAAVTVEVVAEPVTRQRSPAEAAAVFVLQATVLAVAAFLAGRRYDALFENVSHAVRHHPVVSGTVGLLASVSLLALFVFMAFTIVLLPVSVLGLLGGVAVSLFATVALGAVLGDALPVAVEDPGVSTAAGTVAFLALTELVGFVPVVGGLLSVLALLVGIGATLVTYFGLREFHPPALGPVAE